MSSWDLALSTASTLVAATPNAPSTPRRETPSIFGIMLLPIFIFDEDSGQHQKDRSNSPLKTQDFLTVEVPSFHTADMSRVKSCFDRDPGKFLPRGSRCIFRSMGDAPSTIALRFFPLDVLRPESLRHRFAHLSRRSPQKLGCEPPATSERPLLRRDARNRPARCPPTSAVRPESTQPRHSTSQIAPSRADVGGQPRPAARASGLETLLRVFGLREIASGVAILTAEQPEAWPVMCTPAARHVGLSLAVFCEA